MSRLYPHFLGAADRGHKMVACCVDGELHELGLKMVTDFFALEGWETHYLGSSTPHEDIASFVEAVRPDLLCVSVTMTFNTHKAERLIRRIRDSKMHPRAGILVGGFPLNLNPSLAWEIGADAWAENAAQAITEGERLLKESICDS